MLSAKLDIFSAKLGISKDEIQATNKSLEQMESFDGDEDYPRKRLKFKASIEMAARANIQSEVPQKIENDNESYQETTDSESVCDEDLIVPDIVVYNPVVKQSWGYSGTKMRKVLFAANEDAMDGHSTDDTTDENSTDEDGFQRKYTLTDVVNLIEGMNELAEPPRQHELPDVGLSSGLSPTQRRRVQGVEELY